MIHYIYSEFVMCRVLLRLQFDKLNSAGQSNLRHVFSLVENNTLPFYTCAQLHRKSQNQVFGGMFNGFSANMCPMMQQSACSCSSRGSCSAIGGHPGHESLCLAAWCSAAHAYTHRVHDSPLWCLQQWCFPPGLPEAYAET